MSWLREGKHRNSPKNRNRANRALADLRWERMYQDYRLHADCSAALEELQRRSAKAQAEFAAEQAEIKAQQERERLVDTVVLALKREGVL